MLKRLKDFIKAKILSFLDISKIKSQNRLIIKGNFEILYSNKIQTNSRDINFYECKAFSQFGEDGIIRYLIDNIKISNKFFVEFGVEDYEESNTRLLLENNWSGLIIEPSKECFKKIKKQDIYWRQDLKCVNEFVTRKNINEILKKNNLSGSIGLLSIDIDGNDYWVWESINQINPDIVIVEFNPRLKNKSITIPYDPEFERGKKLTKLFYGASLIALLKLGKKKGYSFICTNINSNNAFFVKKELLNDKIVPKSLDECFQKKTFQEVENDINFNPDKYPFEEV
jgi:hypothetical protein